MTCIFCHQLNENAILYQTKHFKVVWDIDPVQTGHLLIISKKHYGTLSQVPPAIRYELSDLEVLLTEKLCQALAIDGVTIACNDRLFDHWHPFPCSSHPTLSIRWLLGPNFACTSATGFDSFSQSIIKSSPTKIFFR
jgi:diadenosine tetraphosphate (Ap4A) HIT family hydrolase